MFLCDSFFFYLVMTFFCAGLSGCGACWLLISLVSSISVFIQGLAQLEILCKQLYETTDTAVRHQAEKALVEFTNSPDCLSKCQLLLERGSVSSLNAAPATCVLEEALTSFS